jgi:hypothetical protein
VILQSVVRSRKAQFGTDLIANGRLLIARELYSTRRDKGSRSRSRMGDRTLEYKYYSAGTGGCDAFVVSVRTPNVHWNLRKR